MNPSGCVRIAAAILDGKSVWVLASEADNQLLTDKDRQIPVFTLAEIESMALAPKEAWRVAYDTKMVMPGSTVVTEKEVKYAQGREDRNMDAARSLQPGGVRDDQKATTKNGAKQGSARLFD